MPCQLVAISWSFDSFSVRLAILDLKNIGRLSFVARIFMKALSSILCLVKSARFVPPGYESRVEVAELSKEEESKSRCSYKMKGCFITSSSFGFKVCGGLNP